MIEARLTLHFPDGTDSDVAYMVMGDAAKLIENHWDVVVSVGLRVSEDCCGICPDRCRLRVTRCEI